MLDIQHVTAGFGDPAPVIADASVTVASGQRLLICGAAGAGKSTLLNIAAGIIPRLVPSPQFPGSVSLHGRPMGQLSKDELYTAVSIVTQNVEDQLWDLGVEDLIAFPLENRGVDRDTIRRRLQALLGDMELDALRGRRVLTLSGGERRMVAIAAALAVAPDLLVLDEPTTGLDPSARLRLVRLLNKLAADIPALLVSEQDPASVRDTIDSVMLLTGGRLSPAVRADEIMSLEAPWLEAGVLPPHRRRTPRRTLSPGRTLLAIAGLRTRLARSNGQPVLQDVGFDIRAGEIVALIGRNGAGKTTLFQSILGLANIVGGSIVIGGEAAQGWTPARRARSIAYLPQNMRRILFNMTVLEEVVFAITAATGAAKDAAAKEKALSTLGKYGLAILADSNPVALSVRQQALLGLACADAAGASIAILDEPLLARDVHGRRMLDLFLDTMLSAGRSVMLISHDLELVDDIASRMLILDEGRITFDGRPDEAWASRAFHALGWPVPHGEPAGEAA